MTSLFSVLESFFFLCLAVSFILILLMVYHFKKRVDALERNNETLVDICKNVVQELDHLKNAQSSFGLPKEMSPHTSSTYYPSTLPFVDSDMLKNIMMSDGILGGSTVHESPLDMQVLENSELDEVESCHSDDSPAVQELSDDSTAVEELVVDSIIADDNTEKTVDALDTFEIEKNNDKEKDMIQVTKLEETEPIDDTVSEFSEMDVERRNKSSLQKMNVQMLRAMVIREGLCTDPSKMKKNELIQLVLNE